MMVYIGVSTTADDREEIYDRNGFLHIIKVATQVTHERKSILLVGETWYDSTNKYVLYKCLSSQDYL